MWNKIKNWLDEELWIDGGKKGATHFHWHIGPRWYLLVRLAALVLLLCLVGFIGALVVSL